MIKSLIIHRWPETIKKIIKKSIHISTTWIMPNDEYFRPNLTTIINDLCTRYIWWFMQWCCCCCYIIIIESNRWITFTGQNIDIIQCGILFPKFFLIQKRKKDFFTKKKFLPRISNYNSLFSQYFIRWNVAGLDSRQTPTIACTLSQ